MENNSFNDMPVAPTPPKLPKYFPDLQGENRGRTPHAGWYQNEFMPWIQSQDPKKLFGYGIGMFLLAGTAVLLGLGIHKYQDQIQEMTGQVCQNCQDALAPYFGPVGVYLGEAKDKTLIFLGNIKEKVMSFPSAFSSTSDVQDAGPSTPTIPSGSRSMADSVKEYLGITEPESGE